MRCDVDRWWRGGLLRWLVALSAPWLIGCTVWAGTLPDTAETVAPLDALPASFEGELPGASNPIAWHVDLFPDGRYQLRRTHVGRPEPNRFDEIGPWTREAERGRIELSGGREPVVLMPIENGGALRKLDRAGKPIDSLHHDRLARLPTFSPIEPRLELTGLYSYVADAPSITLCADGQLLPVAMEADYQALERAYRASGAKPGEPLIARLEGTIAARPSMEESQGPRVALVVERFHEVQPTQTCAARAAESPLRGTYWKLVRLGDRPAEAAAAKEREPRLVFATDTLRVTGSGGCNRVSGPFEVEGERLRFGGMVATRMMCSTGMEQEQRFLDALRAVTRYRVGGRELELLDASGEVRARFEAVEPGP